ncbi:gamma-butyrobetaine hydroxylase-like domain-containing protein [Nitrosomonas sp. wSCUT-2]
MAGLTKNTPIPIEIKLHQKSRILDITFSDGKTFHYSCEFLRVHSPSAEVSGHSPGQEVLQTGKKMIGIRKIAPVGNYAIQLDFTDGHNTGLYSWDLLYSYGLNQDTMWQRYLQRLEDIGASREPGNGEYSE